ncbi:MAG: inactive serine/threonine-protein kinase VRK3, partial [Deltaproteobacteria bacterium]
MIAAQPTEGHVTGTVCSNPACDAVIDEAGAAFCPYCGARRVGGRDGADPLVGRSIMAGRYRVLFVEYDGDTDRIYRAEQILRGSVRTVAIKTLRSDFARDPQLIARFQREAQIVIGLEHPNTIRYIEFGELDEFDRTLFVAMEFVGAERLVDVLARGTLDVARAEVILVQ